MGEPASLASGANPGLFDDILGTAVDIGDSLIKPVLDALGSLASEVGDIITDLIKQVWAAVEGALGFLGRFLYGVTRDVLLFAVEPQHQIRFPDKSVLTGFPAYWGFAKTFELIGFAVWGFVNMARDVLKGAVQFVIDTLVPHVTGAVNYAIGVLEGWINAARDVVKGGLDFVLGDLRGALQYAIDNYLAPIWGAVQAAAGAVGGAVGTVSDIVNSIINYIALNVTNGVNYIIGKTGLIYNYLAVQIHGLLTDIWNAVKGLASGAVDILTPIIQPLLDGLKTIFSTVVDNIIAGFKAVFVGPAEAIADLVEQKIAIPGKMLRGEYTSGIDLIEALMDPPREIITGFLGTLMIPFVALAALTAFLPLFGAPIWEADLQTLRGKIGAELASVAQVQAAWNRGIINDAEANGLLKRMGYGSEALRVVQELRHNLPSATDLVRFGVREVFTPEIATQFGQFEQFPPQLAVELAKQGYDQQSALNYWAAHWELPSVSQGYEMFQRQFIDLPSLDRLLRAQDVMPFWRDKLIQIAYHPLNRIDVRRMYAAGVIDLPTVEHAYRDLGYSPENAARLRDFVAGIKHGTAKNLTAAQIRLAYRRHVLDRAAAAEELIQTGYDDVEADFLLQLDDADLAANPVAASGIPVRDLTMDVIKRAYREGLWDRARATGELEALGFLQAESDIMLDLEDVAAAKDLSDAGEALIREEYIAFELDAAQAVQQLTQYGVHDKRAQVLLAEWSAERQRGRRKLTVPELFKALGANLMTIADVRAYLLRLGYNAGDADVIIQLRAGA